MDDFNLYFRFKNGDMKAFEILYDRYAPSLYRYLLRLLSSEDESKDVLQETFFRLYKSSLTEKGKLSAWLFKVATNQAYRILVKKKRFSSLEDTEVERRSDAEEESEEKKALKKRVSYALSVLPEPQRAVVLLKFYEGFRYREIAEILGCPPGTVKSRMYKALLTLREILIAKRVKKNKKEGERNGKRGHL